MEMGTVLELETKLRSQSTLPRPQAQPEVDEPFQEDRETNMHGWQVHR